MGGLVSPVDACDAAGKGKASSKSVTAVGMLQSACRARMWSACRRTIWSLSNCTLYELVPQHSVITPGNHWDSVFLPKLRTNTESPCLKVRTLEFLSV